MVTLIERYLTEDIEAVKRQYSYIPEEDFDRIIRLDPTFDENRDSVGKYGKWLLNLYKKEPDAYNNPNLPKLLAKYDELKNDRRYNIEKDIMRLRSTNDLENAIGNVETNTLSKKQAQRQAKKDNNYDLVFETNDYWVFVPKNHAGDMVLASYGGSPKATWCTAVDNVSGEDYYDQYLEDGGYYYVLINKNDYSDKYQFHFETDQFMDADDDDIDYDEFCEEQPGLDEFFRNDEVNRYKASGQREMMRRINVFDLDPNRDIDEQMSETRIERLSGSELADYLKNFLNGFNSDFKSSLCAYITNGTVDIDYGGTGYYTDFDGVDIEEDEVYDILSKAGFNDDQIQDFCDGIGEFYENLRDGEYDDDFEGNPDINTTTLADNLKLALIRAAGDARWDAYTTNVLGDLDESLSDIGIKRDTSNWTYSFPYTYYDIEDAFNEYLDESVSDYFLDEAIGRYLEGYLFDVEFEFDEPYYGWDDYPDEESLKSCLPDALSEYLR